MSSLAQAAFPCSGSHRQVWALLLGLTPPPFGGGAGSSEKRTDRFVARMRPSKGVSSSRSGRSLLGCQGLCLPPISPSFPLSLSQLFFPCSLAVMIPRWKIEGESKTFTRALASLAPPWQWGERGWGEAWCAGHPLLSCLEETEAVPQPILSASGSFPVIPGGF